MSILDDSLDHVVPLSFDKPDLDQARSHFLVLNRPGEVREVRADLETAPGNPHAEVLGLDLRNAEAHLAGLVAILRKNVMAS
jgi:hypothetical protein